jgi:hypothetical protein
MQTNLLPPSTLNRLRRRLGMDAMAYYVLLDCYGYAPFDYDQVVEEMEDWGMDSDRLDALVAVLQGEGLLEVQDCLMSLTPQNPVAMRAEELRRKRAEAGKKGAEAKWQKWQNHGKNGKNGICHTSRALPNEKASKNTSFTPKTGKTKKKLANDANFAIFSNHITTYSSTEEESIVDSTVYNLSRFFEKFWELYAKPRGKAASLRHWQKMTDAERQLALDTVEAYVASTPDRRFRKDPERWLKHKCWNDEPITPPTKRNDERFHERTGTSGEYLASLAQNLSGADPDPLTARRLARAHPSAPELGQGDTDRADTCRRPTADVAGGARADDMADTSRRRLVDDQGRLDDEGRQADT